MIFGFATRDGSARFASRFPVPKAASFYRGAQDFQVSTLGQGSYLGEMDEQTDCAYSDAAISALTGGINFFDTSLNYRHQRSERALGAAFRRAIDAGHVARDEFVVCTKAGYLVPGAVPATLRPDDIAGKMHSMAPAFLKDQLERSQHNLGLGSIDVFYLHNPETQLRFIPADEFYSRIRAAFEALESLAAENAIRYYGAATWDGFRTAGPGGLSLARLASIAKEVAGDVHHFRFVQLPFNLAMQEALTQKTDPGRTVLDWARELGITVVASAAILQSRLAHGLPSQLAGKFPGLRTDAQRAIQFTRSTPGITVALAGMSQAAHVAENLGLGTVPPVTPEEYEHIFR
ncbi:MAG TPA: aldo/keto reductase [Bryobacteraceae bacterium]|nr:aldo/keto reductase [Bryobacteraceae bacterium]